MSAPLSLNVDTPASASPFPSPSSSFLPPPVPGAHEFAVKPPPKRKSKSSPPSSLLPPSAEITPTPSTATPTQMSTPTQSQSPAVRPPLSPILTGTSSPSPSLSSTRPAPASPASSRRISTISLTSSPSRTASRRNSRRQSSLLNPKRQSQLGPSNLLSTEEAQVQVQEKDESLSSSPTATSKPSPPTSATTIAPITPSTASQTQTCQKPTCTKSSKRYTKVKIMIRDFAFVTSDDRYRGMGTHVPKPNRFPRLNKKLGGSKRVRPTSKRWSTASTSSKEGNEKIGSSSADDDDDDDEAEDDDEDESEGWFRRGMGRFSWSFGFGGFKRASQQQREEELRMQEEEVQTPVDPYPSRGDLERNFLTQEDGMVNGGSGPEVYYDAEDDVEQQEGEEEEEPLYAGLYKAIYAFEPEGTAEMRLVEDQIVKVIGRGGGVGWAVVVVPDGVEGGVEVTSETGTVRHALVPEGYLEVVELD